MPYHNFWEDNAPVDTRPFTDDWDTTAPRWQPGPVARQPLPDDIQEPGLWWTGPVETALGPDAVRNAEVPPGAVINPWTGEPVDLTDWNRQRDAPPFVPPPAYPSGAPTWGSGRTQPPEGVPGSEFEPDGQVPGPTSPPPQPESGPTTPPPGRWDEAFFRTHFGAPTTPTELLALEDRIKAAGGAVLRNAAGVAGKIRTPDGRIIDVILGAAGGGRGFWWGEDQGGAADQGGGRDERVTEAGGVATLAAPLLQTFPGQFAYPSFEPPPAFTAPTGAEILEDPGYRFRLEQGQQALERAAAAKGALNTGGTLKNVLGFGQDLASQEFERVYNRRLGEYEQRYGHATQDYARDYDKWRGEFDLARNQWNEAQDRPFNKLASIAGLGQTATSGLAGLGAGYTGQYGNTLSQLGGAYGSTLGNMGRGVGDLYTQGANARAAGQVGGANAWAQGLSGIANMWAPLMYGFSPWGNRYGS